MFRDSVYLSLHAIVALSMMMSHPSVRPWAELETEGALDAYAAGDRVSDIAASLDREFADVDAHLKANDAQRWRDRSLTESSPAAPRNGHTREQREQLRGERIPRLHRPRVSRADIPPRPWPDDELEWAQDCLKAGDAPGEIARWSGRSREDVLEHLPVFACGRTSAAVESSMKYASLAPRSDHARDAEILALSRQGVPPRDIIKAMEAKGVTVTRSTIAGVRYRARKR